VRKAQEAYKGVVRKNAWLRGYVNRPAAWMCSGKCAEGSSALALFAPNMSNSLEELTEGGGSGTASIPTAGASLRIR